MVVPLSSPGKSFDRARIADRIRAVFVRSLALDIDPAELSPYRDLNSLAGLDSLAMLEFVTGLEQEFDVEIEPECLTTSFLGDLDALVDYFAAHPGGDAP
jgi:acyl carrier protein